MRDDTGIITVTYDYPRPALHISAIHLRLATQILGWKHTTTLGGITYNDNQTYVYHDAQSGVLKGTAFAWPARNDKGVPYDRTFQAWSPTYDPAAAAELRVALRNHGWRCDLSEQHSGDDANCWVCRLTSADTHTSVVATNSTPEAALALAADAIAREKEHDAHL